MRTPLTGCCRTTRRIGFASPCSVACADLGLEIPYERWFSNSRDEREHRGGVDLYHVGRVDVRESR